MNWLLICALTTKNQYCIFFALLSICAYVPTGRKPALNIAKCTTPNSEVCLSRNSCIQVCMHMRGIYVLNKGAWPNTRLCDCCITACHPSQKGAYLLKSVRIECRHSDFDKLELWTSRPVFRYLCCAKVKVQLYAYMWNVPNSECLGQQNSMLLSANMRL